MIGIYKITSPSNKIYIGQSMNIHKRWTYYNILDCKTQTRLYNSFVKHGVDNHKFEILTLCYEEQLNIFERDFQDAYDVIGVNGLNCKLVQVGDRSGKLSQETKDKIGLANTGNSNTKGRKHSEKSIKKMRESALGRIITEEARLLMIKNSYRAKKVIDTETNIIYNSLKEVSRIFNMKYCTLKAYLAGYSKNKTSFKYYTNE